MAETSFENTHMVELSVIIPTHNRPEMLRRAVASVECQTYRDFELIVIEDRESKGGGWARNQGIRQARGEFIAFLDDDDEWLPEKLETQMAAFEHTPPDVGFCFSAVTTVYDHKIEHTRVSAGMRNYYEDILSQLKGFLNVTLIVKKYVFEDIGYFDESLPSHQETDLVVRIAKKYKGLGINKPLVRVSMKSGYQKLGYDMRKKIAGREIILDKYADEFLIRPSVFAHHCFQLGLWYRDIGEFSEARGKFMTAWKADHRLRYIYHYLSMMLQ